MDSVGPYLLPASLILYIIGTFFAFHGTLGRSGLSIRGSLGVLAVAWVLQLGAIVERGIARQAVNIENVAEYLLVLSWAVLTLHLLVWLRWRIDALGLVLPPLAALMGFVSLQLIPMESVVADLPHRGWFRFHTTVATVGMAILCVAFAMSLIYLIQERALKSKTGLGVLQRLPSLDRCDRLGHQALILGFLLLTLGIVTGVVVNAMAHHRWFTPGAKQSLPLLAWLVFAAVLAARSLLGFRGRKSAYLTIAGVALSLLAVAGMSL